MLKLKSVLQGVVLLALAAGVSSCNDSFIYDGEGDCSAKVQFVFKKHRQALHSLAGRETDAFYSSVGSVHLFVYDVETGELVFEKCDLTENLLSASDLDLGTGTDRSYMPVDLKPGKYRLVAWCGLDDEDRNNAFSLHDDGTRAEKKYTHCAIELDPSGVPVHTEKYDALFHGATMAEIELTAPNVVIPVELTKNTNDIAVWVQHNQETFNADDYDVVFSIANGSMHFDDNSMQNSTALEYLPHKKYVLESETEYNGYQVTAGALVAHLSTARLMEAHQNNARLEVRNKAGETLFSIPLVKYFIQMQDLTSNGQYYLDCEDTYNCSFYLSGDNDQWAAARIIVNNWVIVPGQDSGF